MTPEQVFLNYLLVLAPMWSMVAAQMIAKLWSYVKNDGTLFSGYFTVIVDDTDLLYMDGLPEPLKELFGVDMLYENEHNSFTYKHKKFQIKDYSTVLSLIDEDILAIYAEKFYQGTSALTTKKYGKGNTFYTAARMCVWIPIFLCTFSKR